MQSPAAAGRTDNVAPIGLPVAAPLWITAGLLVTGLGLLSVRSQRRRRYHPN
jgi:hypothetical protein